MGRWLARRASDFWPEWESSVFSSFTQMQANGENCVCFARMTQLDAYLNYLDHVYNGKPQSGRERLRYILMTQSKWSQEMKARYLSVTFIREKSCLQHHFVQKLFSLNEMHGFRRSKCLIYMLWEGLLHSTAFNASSWKRASNIFSN